MKAGVRIGYRYETGEVLFKDFGVSGIAAFNLSSEIARGRAKIGDMLTIDFMPEYSKAEVEDILTKRNNNGTVAELLLGTFHSKVQERIIRAAGCDANDPAQSKIGAIANAIKKLQIHHRRSWRRIPCASDVGRFGSARIRRQSYVAQSQKRIRDGRSSRYRRRLGRIQFAMGVFKRKSRCKRDTQKQILTQTAFYQCKIYR